MKITGIDGTNVDTNDLSDVDSLITKKHKELYELCKKNNVPCYLITLISKGSIISANTVLEKVKSFWNTLGTDIYERSGGKIALAFIKTEEEPPSEES